MVMDCWCKDSDKINPEYSVYNLFNCQLFRSDRHFYIYIYIYLYLYLFEKNEMGGACGAYGEGRGVHRVMVGKLEGKRPLGRPRRRWDDNIKMGVVRTGWSWLRIGTGGGHL